MIDALLIGLGIYMLYRDLPAKGKAFANQFTWLSHAAVFFGLFAMHGGSSEGTVVAAIATVFFRWMMHWDQKRSIKAAQATQQLIDREQYRPQQAATNPDSEDTTTADAAIFLAIFCATLYLISIQ